MKIDYRRYKTAYLFRWEDLTYLFICEVIFYGS